MLKADFSLFDNVFYGNKISKDHAVNHKGDNTSGAGKGDDETI